MARGIILKMKRKNSLHCYLVLYFSPRDPGLDLIAKLLQLFDLLFQLRFKLFLDR
jgi:hypothetical protein